MHELRSGTQNLILHMTFVLIHKTFNHVGIINIKITGKLKNFNKNVIRVLHRILWDVKPARDYFFPPTNFSTTDS